MYVCVFSCIFMYSIPMSVTIANKSTKVKTKQQHLLTSQRQVPPPPIPKRQNISKSENTDIDIMNQ